MHTSAHPGALALAQSVLLGWPSSRSHSVSNHTAAVNKPTGSLSVQCFELTPCLTTQLGDRLTPWIEPGSSSAAPGMRGWAQTEAARAWPSGEWNDHIRASSARQIQTSSVSRLGPQPYEMAMVTPEGQCLWSLWLVDRGVPYRGMGSTTGPCLSFPAFNVFSHWTPATFTLALFRGALRLALPFASSLAVQYFALSRGPFGPTASSSPSHPGCLSARVGRGYFLRPPPYIYRSGPPFCPKVHESFFAESAADRIQKSSARPP